jgi:hypothetical protein
VNEGQVSWQHGLLWLDVSSLQKSAVNYSTSICNR